MKIKNKLIAALSVVAIACTAMAFGISNAYADETVTMIVYKPGLLARKAAPMTGVVRLAPLVDDVERYLDAMT